MLFGCNNNIVSLLFCAPRAHSHHIRIPFQIAHAPLRDDRIITNKTNLDYNLWKYSSIYKLYLIDHFKKWDFFFHSFFLFWNGKTEKKVKKKETSTVCKVISLHHFNSRSGFHINFKENEEKKPLEFEMVCWLCAIVKSKFMEISFEAHTTRSVCTNSFFSQYKQIKKKVHFCWAFLWTAAIDHIISWIKTSFFLSFLFLENWRKIQ